ncbi:MAG: transglycosylase domain-containing protein [Candidatus Woykebacteria bacterium]
MRILSGLVTAGFIFLILFLIGTAVAFGFFARDLPSPDKLSEKNFQQSTKIYDRNGVLLYNVFGEQNRTLVKFDRIPDDLKHATIAIEDKNFYKHKGFDVLGLARAFRDAVFRKKVTGASTLTQQLVKNALLTPERTITRKIKEFILAVQIERRYSKDEILQIYLNEIPYGGTAWGSEAAANQYFGKHVWELSLVESAVLAGLPQSPTVYSPFGSDPEAYIDRTKDVLRRMTEDKFLTKEQEEKAIVQLPKLKFASFGEGIKAPHFSIYVKTLLEEKYGAKFVQEGGLNVTTSLDYKLQQKAQKIVADELKANGGLYEMNNGAAVVQDTRNGEILAMVGSKNYFAKDIQGNFNVATQGLRQPGSALKPFNYLTGFQKGYANPSTILLDLKTDFGGGYVPGNYCNCFNGPLSAKVALGSSRNIPAVKMLGVNGVQAMIDTLKKFGVTTINDANLYGLSLTLGGGAVHLLELNNAYAILGNEGKSHPSVAILKVTAPGGDTLEEFKQKKDPQQVAPAANIYQILDILKDPKNKYLDYGTFWAHELNFQTGLSVKTGTSEEKRDNWVFGTTSTRTVGTWVGNNDNSPMSPRVASGVTGAAPIWKNLMREVVKGQPVKDISRPKDVVVRKIDPRTGQQPYKNNGATTNVYFPKWQAPPHDDMHKEVRICTPTGLLANESCEAAGKAKTKVYLVLYDPYTKLFKPGFKYCKPCPPTKTDTKVYTPKSDSLTVVIVSPEDNQKVGSDFTVVVEASGPNDITAVQFFLDGILKNTKPSKPYTASFKNVSPGDHEVTVRVYDDSGDSVEETIDVEVEGGLPLIHSPP